MRAKNIFKLSSKLGMFSENINTNNTKRLLSAVAVLGLGGGYLFHQFRKSKPTKHLIIGRPAPLSAKNKTDIHRLVWEEHEVVEAGIGNGLEGRSAPTKGQIKLADGSIKYGYIKNSAEGREGLLNELIYHAIAERAMPEFHPTVKLIEHKISEDKSSYTLFSESLGENQSLLTTAKDLCKNPEKLDTVVFLNIGCAIAYTSLIKSGDAFLKNFVIVFNQNEQFSVYPIDFELIDACKINLLVDLNKGPKNAASSLIANGGLADYQKEFTAAERGMASSNQHDDTEVGHAHITLGLNSTLLLNAIITHFANDIRNGNVLAMYQRIARITPEDIDALLQSFDFIMSEDETKSYRDILTTIVKKVQNHIPPIDADPQAGDNDCQKNNQPRMQ